MRCRGFPRVINLEILEARLLLTSSVGGDAGLRQADLANFADLWQPASQLSASSLATIDSLPSGTHRAKTFYLNLEQLDQVLEALPEESVAHSPGTVLPIIALPKPDGTAGRFKVSESPIMAPSLAARYPEIKTFVGQGVDDPLATVRLDRTPAGFHAQVLSPGGSYAIDPQGVSTVESYVSRDFGESSADFFDESLFSLSEGMIRENYRTSLDTLGTSTAQLQLGALPSGLELRTYRLANAATAEYTAFHGGTISTALAAMVTTINRVVGIYEVEVAVRLELVAGNDSLIYFNENLDPYSNGYEDLMLAENQSNIDNVIGPANYDIGHVFGTGGGSIAEVGVVGVDGLKAQGVSGVSPPIGDLFDVDTVTHEMGHQLGANHIFNSNLGSCKGNRNASTAYEPGSGSSIMSYAGICDSDNIQSITDPYFHAASIEQIIDYTTTGPGNAAASITPTGNHVPIVEAGPDFMIPAATPFVLTATASDVDVGDVLTYSWEQFDLGPSQAVGAGDNGSSPLFRSQVPSLDPSRTFPQMTDLLNNSTTLGETLPTTDRVLTFRATVRDNRSGGGGVNWDEMTVQVVATATPFQVTHPNSSISWVSGSPQTVTWDVAGTNEFDINSQYVNILLSDDGGLSFPTVLAANTLNDGSETITVPNLATSAARIKVEASENIFFDVSDSNFAINSALVGIDFDAIGGVSPANWKQVNSFNVPYVVNGLTDEEGTTTPYELTFYGNDGYEIAAVPTANTVPAHIQSLEEIDGAIFTEAAMLSAVWSNLIPNQIYEIYVFGLEDFPDFFDDQQVTIQGAGAPVSFSQLLSDGELYVNGSLGSDLQLLDSSAVMVRADAFGQIIIDIEPNPETDDVSVAGLAIQEINLPDAGTGELIGVDFDFIGGASPVNWTQFNGGVSPTTLFDLANEAGHATPVDLAIDGNGFLATDTVTASPLGFPQYFQPLGDLDGNLFSSDQVTLTWSDLSFWRTYRVYVFGMDVEPVAQNVSISDVTTSIAFVQSSDANELLVNDELGDAARSLESFAEVVASDSSGQIVISVTPVNDFTGLAGVAIEPLSLLGDMNSDETVDATDIDLLVAAIKAYSGPTVPGSISELADVNRDGNVHTSDRSFLIEQVLDTRLGDVDLDGDVDTKDLTTAIINFTGADGTGKKWADGDNDGDGDVDTGDLTRAIIQFTGVQQQTEVVFQATSLVATNLIARPDSSSIWLDEEPVVAERNRIELSPAKDHRLQGDCFKVMTHRCRFRFGETPGEKILSTLEKIQATE